MATGLHSDAILRPEFLEAGFIEGYGQNLQAFNAASNNALRLRSEFQEGEYAKERFWDAFSSSVISRRDLTSTAAATGIKPTMDENVTVKRFLKAGPIDLTHGMLRSMGQTPEGFSRQLGVRLAQRAIQKMLNDGLAAAVAAISGISALVHDATDGVVQFSDLNTGLGKFGDARPDIVAFVMHSNHLTSLTSDGLANYQIENVAGAQIIRDAAFAMGRAIVVTDSASLVNSDGVTSGDDSYYIAGLTEGAVDVVESEGREFVEYFLDRDQITKRIHGELAFNVGVKGFAWDVTNGGANPTDAAFSTSSNWDKVVAENKDTAGILIESDEG